MVPGWGIDPVSRVQPGFIGFLGRSPGKSPWDFNSHGNFLDDMGQPHFRKPPNLITERSHDFGTRLPSGYVKIAIENGN